MGTRIVDSLHNVQAELLSYMLHCSRNASNMLPSRLILGGPLLKSAVTQTKYPAELSKRPVKNYGFACGKRTNKQFPETHTRGI